MRIMCKCELRVASCDWRIGLFRRSRVGAIYSRPITHSYQTEFELGYATAYSVNGRISGSFLNFENDLTFGDSGLFQLFGNLVVSVITLQPDFAINNVEMNNTAMNPSVVLPAHRDQ